MPIFLYTTILILPSNDSLMIKFNLTMLVLFSAIVSNAYATTVTFSSGNPQATLIELYTSEGCSSCPPADRWLSQLKSDPRLWKQIIPIAFHVDYWNYLGWADRFSKPEYSMRQRQYAASGYARTIYTPGFFMNGREWRDWFGQRRLQGITHSIDTGDLSVSLDQLQLTAKFKPATASKNPLLLNVAILGTDISTDVQAGENSGKNLLHDFVVLDLQNVRSNATGNYYLWKIDKIMELQQPYAKALVVWVTAVEDPTPIQAAGGWLKKN